MNTTANGKFAVIAGISAYWHTAPSTVLKPETLYR